MSTALYKTFPDGKEIYILKNEQMEVWLSNLGASILKLIVSDRNNQPVDVVLGYESLEDYPKYRAYLGAAVGRVANRIKAGQFSISGKDYQLPINNGPNCNHGGTDGFSFRLWNTILQDNAITFTLHSPDMEEGFPGNMDAAVTYTLNGSSLEIHYEAVSDQDTLASFTNHSYFNLSGHPDYIGNHLLSAAAEQFQQIDPDGLVTGRILDVEGTPFDFRTPKPIASALESDHEQIRIGKGLDHSFILKNVTDPIHLYNPDNGIELVVNTTLPQAQFYTANWFDGEPGKTKEPLGQYAGIAIETQNSPDDIHLHADAPRTLLKKGEKLDEKTTFSFTIQ